MKLPTTSWCLVVLCDGSANEKLPLPAYSREPPPLFGYQPVYFNPWHCSPHIILPEKLVGFYAIEEPEQGQRPVCKIHQENYNTFAVFKGTPGQVKIRFASLS